MFADARLPQKDSNTRRMDEKRRVAISAKGVRLQPRTEVLHDVESGLEARTFSLGARLLPESTKGSDGVVAIHTISLTRIRKRIAFAQPTTLGHTHDACSA